MKSNLRGKIREFLASEEGEGECQGTAHAWHSHG